METDGTYEEYNNDDYEPYTPMIYISVITCMGKGHYFTLYDDGIDDASQLSTDLHEIVKDTDIETLLESEPCCSITVIADAGGMTTTLIFDQNYELTSIETRPSE